MGTKAGSSIPVMHEGKSQVASPPDVAASDPAPERYQAARRDHWNRVHAAWGRRRTVAAGYHQRLRQVFAQIVPAHGRVLEIGCGQSALLAALRPRFGVGVDFSREALSSAGATHTNLLFVEADGHSLPFRPGAFDVIILSDLVNDLWDVQRVLEEVRRLATARTRVILNCYSRVWELPLRLLKALGLSAPLLTQNWLTTDDVASLLRLAGLDLIRHWEEVLLPIQVPVIEPLANRVLVRMWPFYFAAVSNFFVARSESSSESALPTVSVVVPARNEAGRVQEIIERVPDMGLWTEVVFVEGHSRDNTLEAIRGAIAATPGRRLRVYEQLGEGKGDAVRLGFERSSGDILMILDADLTVAPEELPRFYEAIRTGKGEFANGVRLVYPMEQQAMQVTNLVANRAFGLIFSWIMGQPVRDTLCGTKVLWRRDYEEIAGNRHVFGDFDPFGDFDLLFGAAKLQRRVIDIPVRYRERTYGTTNIRRWRHGVLLARMALVGVRRLKFV
jgi:SAM-dependent methyltransferase